MRKALALKSFIQVWDETQAQSITSYMTLGKAFHLFEPQFLHLCSRDHYSSLQAYSDINLSKAAPGGQPMLASLVFSELSLHFILGSWEI